MKLINLIIQACTTLGGKKKKRKKEKVKRKKSKKKSNNVCFENTHYKPEYEEAISKSFFLALEPPSLWTAVTMIDGATENDWEASYVYLSVYRWKPKCS